MYFDYYFTGNIGSAKSSNGPYIEKTGGSRLLFDLVLRPKVISMFINNEVISFFEIEDIFGFAKIYIH